MNITAEISASSFAKAAAQVREYAKSVRTKTDAAVNKILETGEVQAIGSAHRESGELASSISVQGNKLVADSAHAAFHEFGTGVVGSYSGDLPSSWAYDVNHHGDAGWWYFDEKQGRKRWTRGQRGTAYMAKAAEAMRQEVIPTFQEMFR